MWDLFVRMWLSTVMPFFVNSIPARSSRRGSSTGFRPAATRIRSDVSVPLSVTVTIFPSSTETPVIFAPLYTVMPSLVKISSSTRAASSSPTGTRWGSMWATATFVPRREKAWAISEPMAPPPMMVRDSGIFSISNMFMFVRMSGTSFNPGMEGTKGSVPVAMKIFFAV
ncbi:hypothetical protein SDC9_132603 [bioreactor metagenome]|uniref:Uncharacterized protein n=1 Tax=bioreactor metagenome TaxID=1076179 RepID=A0A645DA81_9ZZZZ